MCLNLIFSDLTRGFSRRASNKHLLQKYEYFLKIWTWAIASQDRVQNI